MGVTQLKLQKLKEGDITLHYIDILAMYCRVLSRRCKPLVFAFCRSKKANINLVRRRDEMDYLLLQVDVVI